MFINFSMSFVGNFIFSSLEFLFWGGDNVPLVLIQQILTFLSHHCFQPVKARMFVFQVGVRKQSGNRRETPACGG